MIEEYPFHYKYGKGTIIIIFVFGSTFTNR